MRLPLSCTSKGSFYQDVGINTRLSNYLGINRGYRWLSFRITKL